MSARRVAHLIETDVLGGAERMLVHLAGALPTQGWTSVAFLPRGHDGWLTRALEAVGVSVEHYHLPRPFSPAFARELARTLQRHQITVAHSHEFTMAFYGAWAARQAGIPHVFTMHGGRYYANRLRRRLALRAAAMLSDAVIAVSDVVGERLARDIWLARSRVTTIPNGVPAEPSARATLREELRLPTGAILIVAVGTLFPVKGHRYLLEAVARLTAHHPGLHVAIAGRGDREPLAACAAALSVAERVHLLGPRADVSNVLASADVFALPSLSEGLPLAGVLVPPGDAAALADALDRLLADPEDARALGERAARRAAATYGLERMVSSYTDLYNAVSSRAAADRGLRGTMTS